MNLHRGERRDRREFNDSEGQFRKKELQNPRLGVDDLALDADVLYFDADQPGERA
jgi:hypothetical protein